MMKMAGVVVCAAALAACLVAGSLGCKKAKVKVHATVNTERASLANITKGSQGDFGGLSLRVDILAAQQHDMMSRLDNATQAAHGLRDEADRLANKWDEAVRAEADEAMRAQAEKAMKGKAGDAHEGDSETSDDLDPNPSGG